MNLEQLRRGLQESGGDPSVALAAATQALRLGLRRDAQRWVVYAATSGRVALPLMIEAELPLFSLPEPQTFSLFCDPIQSNSMLRLQSMRGQPRRTTVRRGLFEDAIAPHLSIGNILRPNEEPLHLPSPPQGPLTAWDAFADRVLVGSDSDSEGPWLAWQSLSALGAGETWRRIPILPGGQRIKETARVVAIRVEGQGALAVLEMKETHALLWIELGTGLRYAWAAHYLVLNSHWRREVFRSLSLAGSYAILFMSHNWRSEQLLRVVEIPSLRELATLWHEDEYSALWHATDHFAESREAVPRRRVIQWQSLSHDDDRVLIAAGAGGLVAMDTLSLILGGEELGPRSLRSADQFLEVPNIITEPERVVEAFPLTNHRALLVIEDLAYVRRFRIVSLQS